MPLSWIEKFDTGRQVELYEFYSLQWWTKSRSFDELVQMLKGSDITIGCCGDNGELIGFARVLTDYTFKAMIFDVIVRQDHQGSGTGREIIDRLINHHALNRVGSFELYCPDRIAPFYQHIGFKTSSSSLMIFKR